MNSIRDCEILSTLTGKCIIAELTCPPYFTYAKKEEQLYDFCELKLYQMQKTVTDFGHNKETMLYSSQVRTNG
jgi:hypothetical protein